MDTKLLHVRNKLEFIIRFMMAGDGSFKARLSEAYRHPQFGLRQIPIIFMPAELKADFETLLDRIDKNEKSKVLNNVKMELMDEIFFFYRRVCDLITANVVEEYRKNLVKKEPEAPPVLIEQSDVPTTPKATGIISELFPTKMPKPKKMKKPKKDK